MFGLLDQTAGNYLAFTSKIFACILLLPNGLRTARANLVGDRVVGSRDGAWDFEGVRYYV